MIHIGAFGACRSAAPVPIRGRVAARHAAKPCFATQEVNMGLHIGSIAPDFEQETQDGKLKFHEWAGNDWVVFFSHPADYTPVCTTELGQVARLKPEFEKRNAKVIALSVDPADSHQGWIKDIEETQDVKLDYPIVADANQKVSKLYDMIHEENDAKLTVRSVFFIDPNKKVRATITYPPSAGRNFQEVLRVLDSLQLTDNYQVATPVDWKDGDDVVIVPSLTDPKVLEEKFPKGYKELKPYLRMTPQPNR
jgi:alkyl hydroperoxide reductase subunit AhpC